MLSSETKIVTYVNKRGERTTYPLGSAMDSANLEMVKRLKYTKDILTHMLNQNNGGANQQQNDSPKNELKALSSRRAMASNLGTKNESTGALGMNPAMGGQANAGAKNNGLAQADDDFGEDDMDMNGQQFGEPEHKPF